MATKTYEIIIYWSDDGAFIAEVPELPGCAADGPTHQEALAKKSSFRSGSKRLRSWEGTSQNPAAA